MKKNILVINGPNLNLLGLREPGHYGTKTLSEICEELKSLAAELDAELTFYQSNHEGGIIDAIHEARLYADGIIMNAGAYTHTSIAIRDALSAVKVPCVELHLSNVHAREEFRHVSMIAPVCVGVIAGFGANSYHLALRAVCDHVEKRKAEGN